MPPPSPTVPPPPSSLTASVAPPACHILECPEGLAQDVISTIGQAFELRFKQYLRNPPRLVTPHDRCVGEAGGGGGQPTPGGPRPELEKEACSSTVQLRKGQGRK